MVEAGKVFAVVMSWMNKTFMMEDINDFYPEYFESTSYKQLNIYVTGNAFMTTVLFIWLICRMSTSYQIRNKTQIEYVRALHTQETYFSA